MTSAPSTSHLPLHGVRVLDLTVVWAGPHCTQLLADWGADVIRVESTQVVPPSTRGRLVHVPKDMPAMLRIWGVAYPGWDPGDRPWNRYPVFQSHARNKRSMTVDIREREGLALFHRLLQLSDVFVENNVPQTIEKLGLTYDELRKVKPDLVMLRMPAYGLDGPYKNFRSFGTHLEATMGHTWVRGYPDMDPSWRDDTYMGDAAGGVAGALAVMLALRHRRTTGEGQLIELAQSENFLQYMSEAVMDYTMNGRVHDTLGNRHPSRAPQGVYRCAGEDRWVTISVGSDLEWRGLCQAMGEPSWTRSPVFATALGRWKNQDGLDRHIQEWTLGRTSQDVAHLLQSHGVPAGPVMDDRDLHEDPQMAALDYFRTMDHPDAGTHAYPGLMWTASRTPNDLRRAPCLLGEDNEHVYQDLLAIDKADYRRLEEEGHIGMDYSSHLP